MFISFICGIVLLSTLNSIFASQLGRAPFVPHGPKSEILKLFDLIKLQEKKNKENLIPITNHGIAFNETIVTVQSTNTFWYILEYYDNCDDKNIQYLAGTSMSNECTSYYGFSSRSSCRGGRVVIDVYSNSGCSGTPTNSDSGIQSCTNLEYDDDDDDGVLFFSSFETTCSSDSEPWSGMSGLVYRSVITASGDDDIFNYFGGSQLESFFLLPFSTECFYGYQILSCNSNCGVLYRVYSDIECSGSSYDIWIPTEDAVGSDDTFEIETTFSCNGGGRYATNNCLIVDTTQNSVLTTMETTVDCSYSSTENFSGPEAFSGSTQAFVDEDILSILKSSFSAEISKEFQESVVEVTVSSSTSSSFTASVYSSVDLGMNGYQALNLAEVNNKLMNLLQDHAQNNLENYIETQLDILVNSLTSGTTATEVTVDGEVPPSDSETVSGGNSDSNDSNALIIGVIVAVLVFVFAVSISIYCWIKKSKAILPVEASSSNTQEDHP